MSQAIPNPAVARQRQQQMQQKFQELIDQAADDGPLEANDIERFLADNRQLFGVDASEREPLSLDRIREGAYSSSELADRMEEVNRLLDPKHVDTSGDVTAEQIRSMSAEQIAATIGAERAMEIVNAEAQR